MEDKNKLKKDCLALVNTLINQYFDEDTSFDIDDEDDLERLDKIVDLAIEKTIKISRSLDKDHPDCIFYGDVVTLSIDGGKPMNYFIISPTTFWKNNDENIKDTKGSHIYGAYILYAYNPLGLELLEKYVGDEFTYSTDEDKKEHTVKILDHQRTDNSARYSKADFTARLDFYNKNEKTK